MPAETLLTPKLTPFINVRGISVSSESEGNFYFMWWEMDKVQLTPTSIDLAAQTYFEIKVEFETWLQKEQFLFNIF